MKQLAIIGPTASGKSDLAIKIALKIDAYILSIDSISVYKEIDVVSAKPSKCELDSVKHYGVNVLDVNERFGVDIFIDLYKKVILECEKNNKNLIIVGGTSFYLKSLLDGLSILPPITEQHKINVEKKLSSLQISHAFLSEIDPQHMSGVSSNDAYRIEKALLIHEASDKTPSEWFKLNPPKPIIKNLQIYNIDVPRYVLRERISKRTKKMLESGLIDEVCHLERKFSRLPQAMGSIGIVEVLEYLDGKVSKEEMLQNISTHTAQLAKRQQTFNKTQFADIISAPLEQLEKLTFLQDI